MQLGAFSVSLAVKDIKASIAFYEALGFSTMGGVPDQNWCIMKNGDTVIGLFQGMFEENIMTFNPGWNQSAQNVDPFTDIREIQAKLEAAGIKFVAKADADTQGPAHFILTDPDGNQIMFDQHR